LPIKWTKGEEARGRKQETGNKEYILA